MATIKKMSALVKMFDISSDIQKSFYFAWKVYEAIECIKPECDIACYIIPLKGALFNSPKEDKTYTKNFSLHNV